MAYLDKDIINSFPSSKRAAINKLMTENSITRLINRLLDTDSYVITTNLNKYDISYLNDIPVSALNKLSADFEFVIRGYYFAVFADTDNNKSGLDVLLENMTWTYDTSDQTEHTLYAGIFIDKTDKNFPELYGQNNSNSNDYEAVCFYTDSNEPEIPAGLTEDDFYKIVLVKHKQSEDGSWVNVIPLTSLFKFNSKSISDIDGGEIVVPKQS